MLNPTPPELLVDARGRPYFLWDMDMTLESFREGLADPDPEVRAYLIGKLMRQAKPDDVFEFVSLGEILASWAAVEKHLGESAAFWRWLLDTWRRPGHGLQ
ncbi:MAG: hypothetical protein JXR96_00745 [Deltaproteobacteria bacterium]|nr:hypothetical protein [Deltaproteobacteria bacterium]